MKREKESQYYKLLRKLVSQLRCPICRTRYRSKDIEILAHHNEVWLINVHCTNCGAEGVIFAVVNEDERQFGELTPVEIRKFKRMPPISADEVLETYQFLQEFNGDLVELLGDQ
ncbi:MAG: hypothetical protein DRI61_05900 [Chloroflexi bacterium]|nr:MAG: hypothetical protein DRI61_05900 [Chloroflexota bacterium]